MAQKYSKICYPVVYKCNLGETNMIHRSSKRCTLPPKMMLTSPCATTCSSLAGVPSTRSCSFRRQNFFLNNEAKRSWAAKGWTHGERPSHPIRSRGLHKLWNTLEHHPGQGSKLKVSRVEKKSKACKPGYNGSTGDWNDMEWQLVMDQWTGAFLIDSRATSAYLGHQGTCSNLLLLGFAVENLMVFEGAGTSLWWHNLFGQKSLLWLLYATWIRVEIPGETLCPHILLVQTSGLGLVCYKLKIHPQKATTTKWKTREGRHQHKLATKCHAQGLFLNLHHPTVNPTCYL